MVVVKPRVQLTEVPDALCSFPTDSARLDELAHAFTSADPFPSIVLDNVIKAEPERIAAAFPDEDWPYWGRFTEYYAQSKRFCEDVTVMPPVLRNIIYELNQPSFLTFLQKITGIRALLPDPYLEGGGLHSSGSGGILAPHTDFHFRDGLDLYRRINVLLYLNPNWDEQWGGCLGLYRKGEKKPRKTIVPEFGRMVIFKTDHNSVHGFADPIAPGRRRDSIALYYYTAKEADEFSGDRTTYWQEHGQLNAVGKVQLATYSQLLRVSSFFAYTAHKFNPNTSRIGAARIAREGFRRPTEH